MLLLTGTVAHLTQWLRNEQKESDRVLKIEYREDLTQEECMLSLRVEVYKPRDQSNQQCNDPHQTQVKPSPKVSHHKVMKC